MAPRKQQPTPETKSEATPELTPEATPATDQAAKLQVKTPPLPKGWDKSKARLLLRPIEQGKRYEPGTLCLISDKPLPEYNGPNNIVVLSDSIIDNLDRQNVTGPLSD